MASLRRGGALTVALLASLGAAATAQRAPPPAEGPVGAVGEAAAQHYALRLRDAEARLRAAHERLAAAGGPGPGAAQESPARQELLDAAREARDAVRNAPGTVAGHPAHAEAERCVRDGLDRLERSGARGGAEADAARGMLQALAALREAAGAPPAEPATGGSTPAEPAAGGGGRT